jgi:hypothetical protein
VETFTVGLKLVESVSGPGKQATDALRKFNEQAQKAQETSGKGLAGFGKQFEKVGFAAARAQKKHSDDFGKMWEKVGLAAAKSQKSALAKSDREYMSFLRKVEQAKERMEDKSLMGGMKEGFGFSKMMSASFVGGLMAEGVMSIVDGMVEGAKKAVELLSEGIKLAFEESAQQQTLRIGERLSLGKGGDSEYREDVGRFSKLTGFDDDVIRKMLLPLRRAKMDQQSARTAFAAAGDVATGEGRGNDAGRVQDLLGSFAKIKMKGGISERMLPELGVDVKDFYESLAKQLGVSVKVAKERASEEGKIDPNILLNTIYRGIEKKQGAQLGTGNIMTSQSFATRLAKVKNLPNEYAKGMMESSTFQRASELLGGLLDKLGPRRPCRQAHHGVAGVDVRSHRQPHRRPH